jgi:predicted transcriptional regulator
MQEYITIRLTKEYHEKLDKINAALKLNVSKVSILKRAIDLFCEKLEID